MGLVSPLVSPRRKTLGIVGEQGRAIGQDDRNVESYLMAAWTEVVPRSSPTVSSSLTGLMTRLTH